MCVLFMFFVLPRPQASLKFSSQSQKGVKMETQAARDRDMFGLLSLVHTDRYIGTI